jgi:DNA-binding GntR family transcriptional regulator
LNPGLKSLDQPASLSKLAYDAILKSILSNAMIPGEIYSEMSLAQDLGISRTPVREALLELSVQGLVEFLPRKGIVVYRINAKDVDEIFEIRRAIDATAAEKLASADPPPDTRLLRKALKKQNEAVESKSYWKYLRADRDFHVTLAQLTGNGRLVAIAENIRNLVHLMGIQALERQGRMLAVLDEHTRIIEAIEQRQPQQAREAVIDHLIKSEQAVLEALHVGKSAGVSGAGHKAG